MDREGLYSGIARCKVEACSQLNLDGLVLDFNLSDQHTWWTVGSHYVLNCHHWSADAFISQFSHIKISMDLIEATDTTSLLQHAIYFLLQTRIRPLKCWFIHSYITLILMWFKSCSPFKTWKPNSCKYDLLSGIKLSSSGCECLLCCSESRVANIIITFKDTLQISVL